MEATELLVVRLLDAGHGIATEGKLHGRQRNPGQLGQLAGLLMAAAGAMAKSMRDSLEAVAAPEAMRVFDAAFLDGMNMENATMGSVCRPSDEGGPDGY